MNEDNFYRSVLKITTDEGEVIWFDIVSKLGDDIKPYVELWSRYTEVINQENFCNFMSNYGIEVYPYDGQTMDDMTENNKLLFCDHKYDNVNGQLRCVKCGNKL